MKCLFTARVVLSLGICLDALPASPRAERKEERAREGKKKRAWTFSEKQAGISVRSTLLLALLGETEGFEGTVLEAREPIAYVPQDPWVFGGTLLENVLFGRPFEAELFWASVAACGLDADLRQLPDAERTVIGYNCSYVSYV